MRSDLEERLQNNLIRLANSQIPLGNLDNNDFIYPYLEELRKCNIRRYKNIEHIDPIFYAILSGDGNLLDKILSLSNIQYMTTIPAHLNYVISDM